MDNSIDLVDEQDDKKQDQAWPFTVELLYTKWTNRTSFKTAAHCNFRQNVLNLRVDIGLSQVCLAIRSY